MEGSWVLLISAHVMSRARSEFYVLGGSLNVCTHVNVVKAGDLGLLRCLLVVAVRRWGYLAAFHLCTTHRNSISSQISMERNLPLVQSSNYLAFD